MPSKNTDFAQAVVEGGNNNGLTSSPALWARAGRPIKPTTVILNNLLFLLLSYFKFWSPLCSVISR